MMYGREVDLKLVNGMMWYRPTAIELDKLETLGNPGWNWASLEPVSESQTVLHRV